MDIDKIAAAMRDTFGVATHLTHNRYEEWESAKERIRACDDILPFNEFTREKRDPDYCLEPMEYLDDMDWKPTFALARAFYGYRYNPHYVDDGTMKREAFNPNDDYFFFNGYGNLVSVDDRDYEAYWADMLEIDDYLKFAEGEGVLEKIAEALDLDVADEDGE